MFGYHAGGWGKPPVDEHGKPLYGDVFGTAGEGFKVILFLLSLSLSISKCISTIKTTHLESGYFSRFFLSMLILSFDYTECFVFFDTLLFTSSCGRNFEDIDLRFFANCRRRRMVVLFYMQHVVIYSSIFS